ncbi:hypothetical protein J1605_013585 [Eschrichtius robustus]|uniref:Basic proline-rich protein-like n=1 Tax=Eschrichtius robustus TaxID=9764 RepID=A0AB34GEQ3_ESCRO|nr:hypothetical protein J1605_013585 [Eschrichtius robustus]
MLSRDWRCCYNPCGPHPVAPSCPSLTGPGPPRSAAGGLLCPGPGLRSASSTRNPNSAGRAPHSHPTKAPFRRRRARAQPPAPPTRGRWGRPRASGLLPQSGCPGRRAHNRRHPGIRGSGAGPATGSQRRGAKGRRPKPRAPATTGKPSTGTEPGGAAHSPGRPPALAADAAPELLASPAARLGCPGAPSSLPGVGELRLAEKRSSSPVPDAQSRGSDEKAKKDAEKGTPPGLGLATSRSPPEVPSSHRHPAGKGHTLSAFLQPPRLPHCSQPLGLSSRTSAPRPPRPSPTPPAPPPEAPPPVGPEVAGAVAEPRERSLQPHVERLQAPPRAQPSVLRRGAASRGREEAEGATPPGSEREASRRRMLC